MRATDFPRAMPIWTGADQVLHVGLMRGTLTSRWVPSFWDRLRLLLGGAIWVTVGTEDHPPMLVTAGSVLEGLAAPLERWIRATVRALRARGPGATEGGGNGEADRVHRG